MDEVHPTTKTNFLEKTEPAGDRMSKEENLFTTVLREVLERGEREGVFIRRSSIIEMRPCLNCDTVWSTQEILSHTPPYWRYEETVAERICQLCKAEDQVIRAISHGEFTLSPMLTHYWKGFFDNNYFIHSCPKCPDLTFTRLIGVNEHEPERTEEKNGGDN